MAKDERMIAALLRERDGYQRRGLDDRVRQVDEQLKHYGYTGDPDENDGPQGRTAKPKRTAAKKAAPSKPAVVEPEPAPESEQPSPAPAD
ncbi:hypothetical protein ACKI1O_32170 [Streptomyces scabiei]